MKFSLYRKFTFHSVMLRDALSELSNAGHVEIVEKVRVPALPSLD